MKRKVKEFEIKKELTGMGKVLVWLGQKLKKHPKIINLNDHDLPKKCIIIANHSGAGGPFNYRVFMKENFMTWGAHQMVESYTSRRRYLRHVFYRKKLGLGPIRSFWFSLLFAIVSPIPYKAAGIIPVYYDSRTRKTYQYSIECLNDNVPVLIYPEDSDDGYKDTIEEFHNGFLMLAKLYYKKTGEDLPIYTIRLNVKKEKANKRRIEFAKEIVIGKPMYYNEMTKEKTDNEIADIFKNYMNGLKFHDKNQ